MAAPVAVADQPHALFRGDDHEPSVLRHRGRTADARQKITNSVTGSAAESMGKMCLLLGEKVFDLNLKGHYLENNSLETYGYR